MTRWVKLYADINSDPRVDSVSLAAQAVYVRLWPALGDDACLHAVPGRSVDETVASVVHRSTAEVAPLLAELARAQLVFVFDDRLSIPKFLARNARSQPAVVTGRGARGGKSDSQRAKEYRARRAAVTASPLPSPVTQTVTSGDASRDAVTGRMATESESTRPVTQNVTARTTVEEKREEEKNPPTPRAVTVEHPAAIDADEALFALRRGSGGKLGAFAAADQLVALARVARTYRPAPLTVADFELIGRAYAAGKCLAWCRTPPDLGLLLANDAKHLGAALGEARAWQAAQARPPVRVVAEVPREGLVDPREVARQLRAAVAASKAKASNG